MTPRHGLGEDRLPLGQPGEPGNIGGEELVALLVGGDGGTALDIGGDRALVAGGEDFHRRRRRGVLGRRRRVVEDDIGRRRLGFRLQLAPMRRFQRVAGGQIVDVVERQHL